jgi:hypothetical protein
MPRDAAVPSGPPAPRGGALRRRPRWLPGTFTLGLLLAGLTTGLLTLGGAAVIGDPAVGEDRSPSCTALHVGSRHAADTHLHLENAGPERTAVRLDFVDHDGRDYQAVGYSPILEPWASGDFVFRTPALGAAVTLSSSGTDLRASAEILRDDGAAPEIRTAGSCRSPSVLPQPTP